MQEMNIKLMMPKVEILDSMMFITLDVVLKTDETLSIALDSICFINRFGEKFEEHNNKSEYYANLTEGCRMQKEIYLGSRKQSLTNSQLILCLTNITEDKEYTISYTRFNDLWKVEKTSVKAVEKKNIYQNEITNVKKVRQRPVARLATKPNENGIKEAAFRNMEIEEHKDLIQTDELSDEEIVKKAPTSIKSYVKAIFREMYYIREKGGRKYRVTNGKYLKIIKNQYVYIFDIDSEIYIAEDSPVRVEVFGKIVEGSVFYTDGFQIMIAVKEDVGKVVSSGFIMVEPWKLLRQLGKSVSELSYTNNPIAMELLEKGPQLADKDKKSCIRKGQDEAIHYTLNNKISIIWGPPGTGKSNVMAEMTRKFIKDGKRVLLVSHSNISVDVVINRIEEQCYKQNEKEYFEEGKILRYGFVRDPNLRKDEYASSYNYALKHASHLKQKMEELESRKEQIQKKSGIDSGKFVSVIQEMREVRKLIADEESQNIKKAMVVGTTISKLLVDTHINDMKYDVVMFDEASMAYVGQIAVAAGHALRKFICVGDFNQLAPICQSEQKSILEQDIFSYLNVVTSSGDVNYHPWLTMLDEQRRTHPDIANFSSKYIYHNLLRTHPDIKDKVEEITKKAPFEREPLIFIDLAGTYGVADSNDSNSRYNILSATIAIMVANKAICECETVGIITPYAAQARLIRAMIVDIGDEKLRNIKCATVHQFQGSECDVIIFDTVENYPFTRPGILLTDNHNRNVSRLVNVAVTRAKSKFIMIANSRFWKDTMGETQNTMYQLLKYMLSKGKVIDYSTGKLQKMCEEFSMLTPMVFSDEEDLMQLFDKDLSNAKEVSVCIPDGVLKGNHEKFVNMILKKQNSISFGIKCGAKTFSELPDLWKKISKGTDNAIFPLVSIDNKELWYGIPFARGLLKGKNKDYFTVYPLCFRYVGEKAIEIIDMFSQLHMIVAGNNQRPLISATHKMVMKDRKNTLSDYVTEHCDCKMCHGMAELKKSGRGRFYLKCAECGEMSYLDPKDVNDYIEETGTCCQKHKSEIVAKVSRFGIYAWCVEGAHSIDLFDL